MVLPVRTQPGLEMERQEAKMTPNTVVALAQCSSYEAASQDGVRHVLELLGGIRRFVTPGQSVFIKPNLLSDKNPAAAVTTHPEVVRALIRLLKPLGVSIQVGDSPANVMKLERVWERTGFAAMCRDEGVALVKLEEAGSKTFHEGPYTFSLARPILDADIVISVPKVKTHVLTILTCGVKNAYGFIPGYQKTMLHKLHPTPSRFGKLLAAVHRAAPPHLTLADGILAMEGDGPSGGSPKHLGFLAASASAPALDLVLCRILRINIGSVPYLPPLLAGPDRMNPRSIEVVGANPDDIAAISFRVPGTLRARLIPGTLVDILGRFLWIRPFFSDACVQCGRCTEACPVQALAPVEGAPPALDAALCVGCCCCHEVCPVNAVTMTQSPFLNFVRKGRFP